MAVNDDLLWQRLEVLRPSLPRHIDFQRRDYSGELWYVLHDKSNGRFHRLTPSAYRLLSFMNGQNTLPQILLAASAPELYESLEEIPTRDELVHLLQYLHVADLLLCDMPPSTQELFARQQQKKKQRWLQILMNPLVWKFSLGNPNRFLERLNPVAKIITSPAMGMVWLLFIAIALVQAAMHWTELTHGQLDKILSPQNLFLLWLTYPLLKVVHELGHGLFTKAWGGDVHEFGVIFMLGTPLPYVDASAATAFKTKRQRMMVSAAGMAVELFLAALALLIWINLEAGLSKDILYNVILIGSVSTLFFNGNPLMRYDGYHLLTDAIDQPNLASRANQQVSYLIRRYAYGLQGLYSPAANPQQAFSLAFYSIAAFFYRLFILASIILLAAHYFPKLGLVLALWLLGFQIFLPTIKYGLFLAKSPALKAHRRRSIVVACSSVATVVLFLTLIPMPNSTSTQGVIWLPDNARIKAEASGEITELFVKDGEQVTQGQVILQLENPALIASLAVKQASLREYEARLQEAWSEDRSKAQLLEQDTEAIRAEVNVLQERVDHLTLRSPNAGRLRITKQYQLKGSYLAQGESVALIETHEPLRVRAALTQEEIGLVKQATNKVELRLASNVVQPIDAIISQEVPAGTFELPSPVLGVKGGGRLTLDASKPEGTKTTQMIFLVDLTAKDLIQKNQFGERAYVRFYHPARPLAAQWYRTLQQIFIRNFQHAF
ncbi:MAG: HlyD family efflux transporter periplasmic adaptor subunit [Gammaproteobacteria bacterium]|nr:MAG: HlyD family efflux transporter periplasmic adaptor subunit [Gammaproteobacteria bacterium]